MSALWISALAETAVRATALLGIAALLTLFLRRRAATTRHLVWALALCGVLILPLAGAVLPGVPMPVPGAVADALPASWLATIADAPGPENAPPATSDAETRSGSSFGAAPGTANDASEAVRADVSRSPTGSAGSSVAAVRATSAWAPVLLAVWAVGAAALGAWLLAGVWNTRRLGAEASEVASPEWLDPARDIAAQLGIRRPVRLLHSERAVMPIAWGWRRPVVIIPAAASGWSPERRAVVLRHELAHVSRGDVVTHLLARWACALYWFNPAVWFAAYRLRVERERACDDEVLRLGTRASDYANHLLDIARECHTPGLRASAAVAMARLSQLEGRMRAILDPKARRTAGRATAFLATAVLTAATLAASATTPVAQTRRPTAAPDAASEQEPRPETEVPVAVPQPAPAPTPEARSSVHRPVAAATITETEPARQAATMQAERPPEVQRVVEQGEEATVGAGRAQQGRGQEGPGSDEPDALTGRGLVVIRNAQGALTQANRLTRAVHTHTQRLREVMQANEIEVTEMTLRIEGQGVSGSYTFGTTGFVPEEEQLGTDLGLALKLLEAAREARREIDPRLVETFIGALTDSDPQVRERSAHALGRLRVSTAAVALRSALEDETAAVRERAAWALDRMSSLRAAADLAEDLVAVLIRSGNGDLAIRGHDLEELIADLGLLGDERALEALIALMDARSPEVRRAAIDALSNARWPSPEERDQAAGPSESTDSPGPNPPAATSPDPAGPVEPQTSPPAG